MIKGYEGSHSRQKLMQRKVAYWLVLRDWLSLLSYTTQNYLPRVGTSYSGTDPSTSITNQETVPEVCLKASLWRMIFFFQLKISLPCYVSSLCQNDMKLAYTKDPAAGVHRETHHRAGTHTVFRPNLQVARPSMQIRWCLHLPKRPHILKNLLMCWSWDITSSQGQSVQTMCLWDTYQI